MSASATRLALGVFTAALALGLVACAPQAPSDSSDGSDSPGSSDSSGSSSDDSSTSDDDADGNSAFVTLPGTGTYVIGQDIPFGGFQLQGEPVGQPEGCTWAILDGDGAVFVENQGTYAFITDVPEAVTFETSGCPDWEQFE